MLTSSPRRGFQFKFGMLMNFQTARFACLGPSQEKG